MPNEIRKGVVYHSGKFHISKLTTDVAEFMGPVQSQTGVDLDASQASGQGAESFIMPTATQVVDYVTSSISANSTYGLDAQSASSGESFAFSLSAQADSLSEKERMDNSRSEILGEIASAMSQAETLVNTVEASAGLTGAGAYITLGDRSSTGLATDGWYIHGASSLANADKKLDEALHAEELARIAQDDVIEASVGLDAAGAYVAPTALNSDVWSPIQTYVDDGTNITRVAKADMATATTVKEADAILRSLIQTVDEKLEFVISGAGVDLNTLVELVNNYNALDTDILTTITSMANLVGLGITDTNPTDGIQDGGQGFTLAAMPEASVTDGSVTKSFPELVFGSDADAGKASTLKSMVEKTRAKAAELMVAMQVELDASQAGAGLGADGAYVSHGAAIYLGAETTLAGADLVLDGAIADIQDKIDNVGSGTQDLLDSFFAGAYASGGGKITADYSIVDAFNELASGAGAGFQGLQDELDRTQAAIGFDLLGTNTDGSDFSPMLAATSSYFSQNSEASLMAQLDAYFGAVDSAFVGFEGGTGLGKDGAYTANATANYIGTAGSLQDADNKLDAALKAEETERLALESNLAAHLGFSDGAHDFSAGGVIAATDTVVGAIEKIASHLNTLDSDDDLSVSDGAGQSQVIDLDVDSLKIQDQQTNWSGDPNSLEANWTAGSASNLTVGVARSGTDVIFSASLNSTVSVEEITAENVVQGRQVNAEESQAAPIQSGHVFTIHNPFTTGEASGIKAGRIVCAGEAASPLALRKADIGVADKMSVLGVAFDYESRTGIMAETQHNQTDALAIIPSGNLIQGMDFSACTSPVVGEAVYLSEDGLVSNVIPEDRAESAPGAGDAFDAKGVYYIGIIMGVASTTGFDAGNKIWFDPKLVAMEA